MTYTWLSIRVYISWIYISALLLDLNACWIHSSVGPQENQETLINASSLFLQAKLMTLEMHESEKLIETSKNAEEKKTKKKTNSDMSVLLHP